MKFTIVIGEEKNRWDRYLAEEIFNLLLDNPFFQRWDRMVFGFGDEINMDFNPNRAIKEFLDSKGEFSVLFNANETDSKLIISRLNNSNKVSMTLNEQQLLGARYTLFLDYMLTFSKRLPKFNGLTAKVIYDYNEFYEKHHLRLVKCCGILKLSWVHVIAPSEYEGNISKADLLATPAFLVKELENESVLIQVYENPFEYDNETAVEYMRNVTEHLRSKRIW